MIIKYILININKMEILKAVKGTDATEVLDRCEHWAEILMPKSEFYILGDTKKDLKPFSMLELQMLYRNETGREIRGNSTREGAIENVHWVVSKFPEDDTPLNELKEKLGKPIKAPTFKPVSEKAEPKQKTSGELPKRPKANSMTARAWECGDYYYAQDEWPDINAKEFRDYVIGVCVESGVNKATAATQFAKWKKVQINS